MNTFFTDRDLGKQFGVILKEASVEVELFFNHFVDKELDERWIRSVAKRSWFILTHDERIRYRPTQRDAVMKSGAGLFVVVGAAPSRELAANFVRTRGRVEAFIARHPRPFIAKIYRPAPSELTVDATAAGRVEMWLTRREWLASKRLSTPRRR